MSHDEELQLQIQNLTGEEFSKLRDWFLGLEVERWIQQISNDFRTGKFQNLIEKAKKEFDNGESGEL